ncbi:MAG: PQQ-binding-like beta-propeller repeat protein [Fimbriimonadaceae bacterium]|nr:PQQ-binding-like beta-propeller repeat protein [Fimbriimonadaceae bacterium]
MRRWFVVTGLGLLALRAAVAFVYVPTRGDLRATFHLTSADALQLGSCPEALVFVVEPSRLRAVAADDGDVVWDLPAPDGFSFGDAPLPAGDAVLAIARNGDTPAQAVVQCVELDSPRQAKVRWRQEALSVPRGGVHVPLTAGAEGVPLGVVLLLAGEQLHVLDLDDGRALARVTVGYTTTAPIWDGPYGLLALATGPALQAVQVDPRSGNVGVCKVELPGGDRVTGMRFDAVMDRLVMQGATRRYAADFVFIPTRGEPTTKGVVRLTGEPDDEVRSVGEWLLLANAKGLRAVTAEDGRQRWQYRPPIGWELQTPVQASTDRVLVELRGEGGQARLVVLETRSGTARWQAEPTGLATGGARLPLAENPERDLGVVATLEAGELVVRDAANGELRGRRRVGTVGGPVLWVADSGFATTSDGYESADGRHGPAVVGFDLLAACLPDDPSRDWRWRLPRDEEVLELGWLPDAGILTVRTAAATYLF